MYKFKGYTEDEIKKLCETVESEKKNNGSLSHAFFRFAFSSGRAVGAVRNFYYSFYKECEKDENLRKKFFSDFPPLKKSATFDEAETEYLIKKITEGKKHGRSARNVIEELSGGNSKLMLRYQNKYRNYMLKNNSFPEKADSLSTEKIYRRIENERLKNLKDGIDELFRRVAEKEKTENEKLRCEIEMLKRIIGAR